MATARRRSTALGELELYTEPAPGKHSNEDLIDADGPAAWLLDGASASDDPQACTEHDASWYTNQLSAAIRGGLALDPQRRDLSSVLADAIATVTEQHDRVCPHAIRRHGPSATVVIVRRREGQLDYLVLGDSMLLVEANDRTVHHHGDKRLAEVAPELRAEILDTLRSGRGYEDQHRKLLADLRAQERTLRNIRGGFWIASDNPEAAFKALTGTYDINAEPAAARRVAIVSDGLGRAVTHLGLYADWQTLMTALLDRGVATCVAAVREAERRDPTGHDAPRTRPADDASAVVCDLTVRERG